jgi:teichoic acid transport system permease protein
MSTTPDSIERDETSGLRPVLAATSTREYLRQMWERRAFAVALPAEEVRAAHQDTFLGNVWHLFNPLLSVGVYYLTFGLVLNVSRGIDNYILWLTIGVFTYNLTSRSVLSGASSISSNAGLMRAMRFPRALLPVSTVMGRLITFGFELATLLVVALVTGEGVSRRLLVVPVIVVVHTSLNLGGAFIAARLNDSYRDIQQVIPFFFQLMRFMSGVMFPVDRFLEAGASHGWISRLIGLNPLVQILNMYRWAFMGTAVDPVRVLESVVISAALLVFGFRFFRANELEYGRR